MGRNIVKHLLENHFEVRVLDVAPEKIADIKHSALEVIEGSITELNHYYLPPSLRDLPLPSFLKDYKNTTFWKG